MKRRDVFRRITESLIYGNLGMFIGAGFTKSICSDGLSWKELIKMAADKTVQAINSDKNATFDFDRVSLNGKSYPEVATEVCKKLSIDLDIEYESVCKAFKARICEITLLHPRERDRKEFNKYLKEISPSWVITTNYDTIIESIIEENYVSYNPEELLLIPKGKMPIYHLHGHRSSPDSLVILNEDYIKLFRPNEYRQLKLSLILKESTALFLGYGLGDINVLTAVDWANNVFEKNSTNYPHHLIQVLYKRDNPKTSPYEENGIIIIETDNLKTFMSDLYNFYQEELDEYREAERKASDFKERLSNASDDKFDEFIDNNEYRAEILNEFCKYSIAISSTFLTFLSNCLDKAWERTSPNGAFKAYAKMLKILIDIFSLIEDEKFPEAILNIAVLYFDRLSHYIGTDLGKSHAAYNYWYENKSKISPYMIEYLKTYADNTWQFRIQKLLE